MSKNNEEKFDAFVSYYEETGDHYAEKIKNALKNYDITTFVAHLECDKFSGNFEKYINKQVKNCKYFILLITKNSLRRSQVIREIKKAFPLGKIKNQYPKTGCKEILYY